MRTLFRGIGRFGSVRLCNIEVASESAHAPSIPAIDCPVGYSGAGRIESRAKTACIGPLANRSVAFHAAVATSMLRRFFGRRDANVAVIFSLMMVPTIYLLGMALDYTQAYHKQSQLDAAADAAAIAAITPVMLAKNESAATTAAQNIFNATANALSGLTTKPTLTVNVSNNGLVRTAVVSYTAASVNNFPILLGKTSWPIQGSSTATAKAAPNINFYLLLDDSPSMAIAGTTDGINTMLEKTPGQENGSGCAFACHESNPDGENKGQGLGNPDNDEDNYALAGQLGVVLRIGLVGTAVSDLMAFATKTEAANYNTYRAAIYTFDYGLNTIYPASGAPSADLTTAGSTATIKNIQVPEVYENNWLTSSDKNDDTDTDFNNAMSSINTIMPAPGGGTNAAGDTPQEVLFIVTDGVDDKTVSSTADCSSTGTVVTYSGGIRCEQPFDTTWCTTIKNRGIGIAVLYTEYLQLPTDAWYNSQIAPFNTPNPSTSPIATNLQACATTGWFYDVETGGDISSALQALFQLVVNTAPARLTQ